MGNVVQACGAKRDLGKGHAGNTGFRDDQHAVNTIPTRVVQGKMRKIPSFICMFNTITNCMGMVSDLID